MGAQLRHGPNPQQPGDQPGVVEVELGHLHDALPEIAAIGRQAEHDEGGFQDGEPRFRGRLRDATIPRQRGQVQELPSPARTKFGESLEGDEIAHIQDDSYVPLKVGHDVRPQPAGRIQLLVEDAGIAAGK
jgi:hypothetical protein